MRSHENTVMEPRDPAVQGVTAQPCEERHHPVAHWARLWGFSATTIRDWFRDEYGPGILRQANTGRRQRRDYTTITVSASAAARIYAKRTGKESIQ